MRNGIAIGDVVAFLSLRLRARLRMRTGRPGGSFRAESPRPDSLIAPLSAAPRHGARHEQAPPALSSAAFSSGLLTPPRRRRQRAAWVVVNARWGRPACRLTRCGRSSGVPGRAYGWAPWQRSPPRLPDAGRPASADRDQRRGSSATRRPRRARQFVAGRPLRGLGRCGASSGGSRARGRRGGR